MTETLIPDALARIAPRAGTCPGCGKPAEMIRFGGRQFFECDPCANREATTRALAERRTAALKQWHEITPSEFQQPVDALLLAPELRPALDLDGTAGAALLGYSFSGKTRVGYHLLKKAATAGHTVFSVTHTAHRQAVADSANRDPKIADAGRTLRTACLHAHALLIDDIGKGAPAETGDAAFFELLTHRRDHGLITHFTANAGSKWLKTRFGADRGQPLIIRLNELTKGRIFTVPHPPE